MVTVYIASPYTLGDVVVNVRESLLVADKLVELGYAPYPPLYAHFWHFLSPKPYETWVKLDEEWVLRCDALLRLPGESSGADAEVELAKKTASRSFTPSKNLRLQISHPGGQVVNCSLLSTYFPPNHYHNDECIFFLGRAFTHASGGNFVRQDETKPSNVSNIFLYVKGFSKHRLMQKVIFCVRIS